MSEHTGSRTGYIIRGCRGDLHRAVASLVTARAWGQALVQMVAKSLTVEVDDERFCNIGIGIGVRMEFRHVEVGDVAVGVVATRAVLSRILACFGADYRDFEATVVGSKCHTLAILG